MIFLLGVGAIFIAMAGLLKGTDAGAEIVQTVEDNVQEALPSWNRFDAWFQQYGGTYGVDWTWLKAIALNESSLGDAASVKIGIANPDDVEGSKSSDGLSWGLMQVTLKTAKGMDPGATAQLLNSPEYSIRLGARYVRQLQNQFSKLDDRYQEWVIKSYNQGPGNTKKEMVGTIAGYAQAYWERFQRNLERVEENS